MREARGSIPRTSTLPATNRFGLRVGLHYVQHQCRSSVHRMAYVPGVPVQDLVAKVVAEVHYLCCSTLDPGCSTCGRFSHPCW